jgi:hypothetical protein
VVPNIKNIDGRFGLDLAARSLALDDVEISGQGLEVLGWMHKRVGQKNNGRFFVKYKALAAGLGQKDGKSSVHLANPRRWFDEQPRSGPSQ